MLRVELTINGSLKGSGVSPTKKRGYKREKSRTTRREWYVFDRKPGVEFISCTARRPPKEICCSEADRRTKVRDPTWVQ